MLTHQIKMPISFLRAGAVVYINYPFEDKEKSKPRPAVILSYANGKTKVVMLKVSSQGKYINVAKYPYAYKIKDTKNAGLDKDSYVLTNKELLVLDSVSCVCKGQLSTQDLKMVNTLHNKAVMDRNNITQEYNTK